MTTARLLAAGLATLLVSAANAHAQRLELTPLTAEQRWDRASMHVTLFTAMYIRDAMVAGRTPADAGRELATFFGPWPAVATPEDMARTIYRNWQLWRTMEYAAEKAPDGSMTITTSRPYVDALERYSSIGVTPADFDAMFGAFHAAIAARQGLTFQHSIDGSTVRMHISRR